MKPTNELDYAAEELSAFREAFPGQSDESYRIIRMMIIEAYRKGYDKARGVEQLKLAAQIQRAFVCAGYTGEPTEANLKECFLDYVGSGAWSDLDYEEAKVDIEDGDITISDMIQALIKLRG